MRWIMEKIKSINNIYNEEEKSFEEVIESLIFSYLDETNDN